jgi:hypothetical protein
LVCGLGLSAGGMAICGAQHQRGFSFALAHHCNLLRLSDLAYGDFKASTLEKTPSDLQSEILFGWLRWNGMSHTNRDNCEGSPLFVNGVL